MNEIDFKIHLNIRNNIFFETCKCKVLITNRHIEIKSDIWGYISGRVNIGELVFLI
jgi:hypothetical protein